MTLIGSESHFGVKVETELPELLKICYLDIILTNVQTTIILIFL